MKKIKSFTLLELMISLLISGIVISISYYVYFLFSAQFVNQQKRSNTVIEFQLFQKAFQNDMANALFVSDSLEKTMVMFNSDSANIYYFFAKDIFVRSRNEKNDTFSFPGRITNLKYLNDSIFVITEIEVETILEKVKINSVFSKRYSAHQIMQTLANE